MSFISSVVSDIKSIATDPGKVVADAANAVLPSNMKAVGDILGGITDINTGNPLAALSHLSDALKDLPQLMQALGGAAGGAANAAKPAGTAGAEPSPPQARSASTSAPATTTSSSTPATTSTSTPATATVASTMPTPVPVPSSTGTKAQTPTVSVVDARGAIFTQVDDGTNTTRVTETNGNTNVVVMNDATGKTVGHYSGSASDISVAGEHVVINKSGGKTVTTIDNGTSTATVNQNGAATSVSVSQDRSPNGINQFLANLINAMNAKKPSPATTPATAPTASAPTAASAPAASGGTTATAATTGATASSGSAASTASSATGTSSASGSSSTSSAAPADLASLMALSPDQFMQAVTSGKIPPDVANDQSAMMQVQARMNQITQMNQLVTSMMAAAHQMQMSIIQNIRC